MDRNKKVNCVSFKDFLKDNKKVLQFKYQRNLNSDYTQNYPKHSNPKKQPIWNLDKEKRQLKVPYNPPKTFITSNGNAYIDAKGTGLIGAPPKEEEFDIMAGLWKPDGRAKTSAS